MVWIGDFYYMGSGVEQDYEKALEWYEKAVDLKCTRNEYDWLFLWKWIWSGSGLCQSFGMARKSS